MKAKNMIVLVFCLYALINTNPFKEYTYNFTVLHENSETAKVCQLKNGDVLAISSGYSTEQITNMTKFDKDGHPIYEKYQLLNGFSPSSMVVESRTKATPEYYLFHHNKQKIAASSLSDQNITTFKDKGEIIKSFNLRKRIYGKISMVPLKSGKIFLAGIDTIAVQGDQTKVELNIYNPDSNKIEGGGVSFDSYGKLVSCFEQNENEIYCAHSYLVNPFVISLSIKLLKITSSGITIENADSIKIVEHWYTIMNFLKAIPLSKTEAAILVQIGVGGKNEEIPFGNSGKDLFFFHISTNGGNIEVKRMEYLSNSCTYVDDKEEFEYYNADIIALSEKRIIAVCESGDNKFQGI